MHRHGDDETALATDGGTEEASAAGGDAQDGADAAEPAAPKNPLSPAAERALAEAAERRAAKEAAAPDDAVEVGGRKGPEPVRYGDWEVKGIATDF